MDDLARIEQQKEDAYYHSIAEELESVFTFSAEGRGERRVRIAPSLSGAVRLPPSRLVFAEGRSPDEAVGQPPLIEETP